MFSVPIIVIILENEVFYKFSSIFEMNTIIFIKVRYIFTIDFTRNQQKTKLFSDCSHKYSF